LSPSGRGRVLGIYMSRRGTLVPPFPSFLENCRFRLTGAKGVGLNHRFSVLSWNRKAGSKQLTLVNGTMLVRAAPTFGSHSFSLMEGPMFIARFFIRPLVRVGLLMATTGAIAHFFFGVPVLRRGNEAIIPVPQGCGQRSRARSRGAPGAGQGGQEAGAGRGKTAPRSTGRLCSARQPAAMPSYWPNKPRPVRPSRRLPCSWAKTERLFSSTANRAHGQHRPIVGRLG